MHLEKRKQGRKLKYYLAHSFRRSGKVRKVRLYLGSGLTRNALASLRNRAEEKLGQMLENEKRISDPLETILSRRELEELKTLESKARLRIAHLSEEEWKNFTEAFTYDTNAIEGSTIGSKEVAEILEKGKWPDKPKGDISETYGVANAIAFIRKTKERLSLPLILQLHRTVFQNSKPFAGKLRAKGVEVVVADRYGTILHRGAPSSKVRSLLARLVDWYGKNAGKYPPLVLAAVVHNQFENVHPFQDGNGRVGRLLLNNILLKHGLPPLNIELRKAYETKQDLRPTIELMLKEYRALKPMLKKR